jgi:hypothetical protein
MLQGTPDLGHIRAFRMEPGVLHGRFGRLYRVAGMVFCCYDRNIVRLFVFLREGESSRVRDRSGIGLVAFLQDPLCRDAKLASWPGC